MDIVEEIKKKIIEHRKKEMDITKIKPSERSPFNKNAMIHEPELLSYYRAILGEIQRRFNRKKRYDDQELTDNQIAHGVIKWYYNTLLNNNTTASTREIMSLREDGFWSISTNEVMNEREIELHILYILNTKENENKSFKDNPNKKQVILNEFMKRYVPQSANQDMAKIVVEKIFKTYQK